MIKHDFKVGDRVRYKASHGFYETGVVSSVTLYSVWVRYDFQHDTAPGQLTPVEQLEKVQSK